eukprot:gnl/MRDRNA2_/MRDRNA2_85407_c0_seq2.p1 gnl/MRDRNA2_/MRDRNA2_85407_c0~~gnl/MRDRNA2_/MRDRNA2_85407_c0_seq2.p1  ORF type:complete len:134 (-),score=9.83 gnl/MRDRNA2_/MRDRNA2_85407_c0_seq2:769-1119(-)
MAHVMPFDTKTDQQLRQKAIQLTTQFAKVAVAQTLALRRTLAQPPSPRTMSTQTRFSPTSVQQSQRQSCMCPVDWGSQSKSRHVSRASDTTAIPPSTAKCLHAHDDQQLTSTALLP